MQDPQVDPGWADLYQRLGVAVRLVERGAARVEPSSLGLAYDVLLALRDDPPDVVVTQDWVGPAYAALRMRRLGLAFPETLFVVRCSGPTPWVAEANGDVLRSVDLIVRTTVEKACVEDADVLVSPSAYLLEWMRTAGWRLPDATVVIPTFTRSAALAEPTAETASSEPAVPVRRIAFFGRLEERKGIAPFVAGLNALGPALLEGKELLFLGRETPRWTADSISSRLTEEVRGRVASVRFETALDQPEALAELRRPGTLAIMPSLVDNSPCTVYECLEHGIPFLAGSVGGAPELIADEDKPNVIVEPTPEGVAAALTRVLVQGPLRARPSFDPNELEHSWREILEMPPRRRSSRAGRPLRVSVLVVRHGSTATLERCLAALGRDDGGGVEVVVCDGREAALHAARGEWIVFLDDADIPADVLIERLVRAQAASGADVVTCGAWIDDRSGAETVRLFLGEPGELGLVGNHYGATALIRRSLLDADTSLSNSSDPDWSLLARLSLDGAGIVSVPEPLVRRAAAPASALDKSADATRVLQLFEEAPPTRLRGLARLTVALAAMRPVAPPPPVAFASRTLLRRSREVLRDEGVAGLARRAAHRLRRLRAR